MKTDVLPPEASGAVSVRRYAARLGIHQTTLIRWCRRGRVLGASLPPLTHQWWIYPPAKILYP
jgi:phage antirepressor YoqD-like protein